jgi:DNA-binding winged helix-turn-helix (wHTH) protein/predicted Zn-dependent protease
MAATPHSSPDFRVGDWLAQPRLSRIEGNGQTVRVTPRAMAVLVYLAQKQGAVVSRSELLDAIWPRMAVTQDALSQCLVELRKAFVDDSKDPRVIETIPKVGVRLIAPISAVQPARSEEPPSEATNDKPTRRGSPAKTAWLTAAAVLAGVALLVASRFSGLTNPTASQRSQRCLAAADPEARDLYLSAVDEYSSRSDRREALAYEQQLLERAVTKDPLFACAWARLGWTHTAFFFLDIDRTMSRVTAAENALETAFRLDPELPEGHLYLGNYLYRVKGEYNRALAELEIAEKTLSANPQLHLIRSSIYRQQGEWSLALEESRKAVALDRGNPFYRRQLFFTQIMMRDYAGADATLDSILALYPDNVTAYTDKVRLALVSAGNPDLAKRYDAGEAAEHYRGSPDYAYTRWLAAIFDGEYDIARSVLDALSGDELVDVELQSWTPKSLLYARTLSLDGQHERARAKYKDVADETRARLDDPGLEDESAPALYLTLAEAEAALGNQGSAREAARHANDLFSQSPVRAERAAWRMAYVVRVLVPLGDDEEALNELGDYLSKPGGIWSIEGLRRDPRLERLHDNPRFAALEETYGRD